MKPPSTITQTKPRCKRCGGNLFIGLDPDNHIVVECLQCGWEITGKTIQVLKRMESRQQFNSKRFRAKRQANHLCIRCGKPSDGHYSCPECRQIQAAAYKGYSARHLAKGLCRNCPRPVKPGRTHCQRCLDKIKDRRREKVLSERIRA